MTVQQTRLLRSVRVSRPPARQSSTAALHRRPSQLLLCPGSTLSKQLTIGQQVPTARRAGNVATVSASASDGGRRARAQPSAMSSITKDDLNADQIAAFKLLESAVNHYKIAKWSKKQVPNVYFVEGPAGSGKTSVIRALADDRRKKGEIVIEVSTTGVAALLLTQGTTVHSFFRISHKDGAKPSSCVTEGTFSAKQIKRASLLILDEAAGIHKDIIELVSNLMSTLLGNALPFGGMPTVLSGDCRQVPPIVHEDPVTGPPTVEDMFAASLQSLSFWDRCVLLQLHANMRLQQDGSIQGFTPHELEQIGDGTFPTVQIGDDACIKIPDELCLPPDQRSEEGLIRHVWGDLQQHQDEPQWMIQRAIMTTKYITVDDINEQVTAGLFKPDEEPVEVLSKNYRCSRGEWREFEADTDSMSGLQPHRLLLKLGLPVMLLKNDSHWPRRYANGTLAVVSHIQHKIPGGQVQTVDCKILTGRDEGLGVTVTLECIDMEKRIDMATQDAAGVHYSKRRRWQFPMRTAFAYTIRKSQGQTLQGGGVYLPDPVRDHGDLYTTLTRFSSWNHTRILALSHPHPEDPAGTYTPNIVHTELLVGRPGQAPPA